MRVYQRGCLPTPLQGRAAPCPRLGTAGALKGQSPEAINRECEGRGEMGPHVPLSLWSPHLLSSTRSQGTGVPDGFLPVGSPSTKQGEKRGEWIWEAKWRKSTDSQWPLPAPNTYDQEIPNSVLSGLSSACFFPVSWPCSSQLDSQLLRGRNHTLFFLCLLKSLSYNHIISYSHNNLVIIW